MAMEDLFSGRMLYRCPVCGRLAKTQENCCNREMVEFSHRLFDE